MSVAVVTGGARGLGECVVRRLHRDGFEVAIADLDLDGAAAVAAGLDGQPGRARPYQVDVSDRAQVEQLLDHVLADLGEVEVLVNNAARTKSTPVMEITADELESVLRVNLHGTFFGCQVFGAHMAARGYGRIVNMASLAAHNGGTATGAHYAASKGGVISATKVFARDLAARGVTVNAVSPGPQDTEVVRATIGEDNLDAFVANIPVQRLGDPDFIAAMVSLLCSREASSVTGASWDANGGLYLR